MPTSTSNSSSRLLKLLLGQREKWLSGLGAFIAISTVALGTQWLLPQAALVILPSMGASAVLLFALPHAPLSQPWPVVGGHLISGVIGVAVQQWLPGEFAAALAVGAAITAMYFLRCLHPPGGATALMAVIGGGAGWAFVWQVCLLNLVLILLAALVFNAPFPWRRYPNAWHSKPTSPLPFSFAQEDFAAAITEIDTLVDVSPEDLQQLVRLACEHAQAQKHLDAPIAAGCYYSNGALGDSWAVRLVLDINLDEPKAMRRKVIYK
ncbi:MAG TPA: HPP family protein, partial [Marinagarivorans sp.]|nr:HPP family protein [Marinagarivorans sp.]